MKKAGIVVFLSVLFASAGFHVEAQERRMVALLEIRPEYTMPIQCIAGFDLSGITVTATHPEITQVSISSTNGVGTSFLQVSDPEQQARFFQESMLGADALTISFY